MDTKKRAIILDMDETLEHGIFKSEYVDKNGSMMVLRPNLDELISKLQEAKNQGVDIVLCTTAKNKWVERLLTLKPELRTLFNRILTRDNESEWLYFDVEKYPLECKAGQTDPKTVSTKPVTTFGYDSILFIDDNPTEPERLSSLFKITQGKLEKDVTFFTGFGFNAGDIDLVDIFRYKKASTQSTEIAQRLEKYLELERNNPGCLMMCSLIDNFIHKEFSPGLILADQQYSLEYEKFDKQISLLTRELGELTYELEESGEELFGYSDSELEELEEYLATDKKYPYEGIEISRPEIDKREQIGELIQIAQSTQAKLEEAQKLEEDYKKQQPKEI